MIPLTPTTPNKDMAVKSQPSTQWAKTAPENAIGMPTTATMGFQ